METAVMDQAVRAVADREGKYLTFALAGEEYGIGILKVKEIIGLMPITTVPQTPGYVKGVINLRGKVIPVADLRLKFGMEAMEYNERTCIIVVEVKGANQTILMGIVVDSVSEVLNIKGTDIEDTPNFGSQSEHRLHPRHGQDQRLRQDPPRHRPGLPGRGDGRPGPGVIKETFMLTEIIIAFGVLAVGSGILIGVLALLYGKDRPTKMYLPVFPIMFFLAIVFFIFGKYGASNYTVVAAVLAVITVFGDHQLHAHRDV